jgi:hypothetical protein
VFLDTRPIGPGCDIGAVEAPLALFVPPAPPIPVPKFAAIRGRGHTSRVAVR